MIQPGFATMLCFVQTDAALQPETADLLLGVCVKRSFDRISVDGQLSTNDTAILMASGASGVIVAPESEDELRLGEALDYALRRLALPDRARRRGRRRGSAACTSTAATSRPSSASRARSPTRRSSRPRCTAATRTGAGSRRRSAPRCPAPRRCRSTSGSRACRCARPASRSRTTPRALAAAVAGEEVEYVVGLPGRGRRDRGVLLRPLARVRDASTRSTRRERAMRRTPADRSPRCSRRCPYIREFHGRTVVIKYGGAAMERPGAARGLRARRRAAQVRRDEPDRRPRRRARHHALHGAARPAGGVRRRPARVRRGHGRDGQDGARRQGQQGHRAAARPPRAAGGRAVRRRRAAVPRRHDGRPGGRGHRLRRPDRARRRGRDPPRRRATTSRSSRRSAPTATAARTTSTPTRRPARSRARWAPTRSSSSPTSRAGSPTRPTPAR